MWLRRLTRSFCTSGMCRSKVGFGERCFCVRSFLPPPEGAKGGPTPSFPSKSGLRGIPMFSPNRYGGGEFHGSGTDESKLDCGTVPRNDGRRDHGLNGSTQPHRKGGNRSTGPSPATATNPKRLPHSTARDSQKLDTGCMTRGDARLALTPFRFRRVLARETAKT